MNAYDPPSLLEFRWGDGTHRFELQHDGGRTSVSGHRPAVKTAGSCNETGRSRLVGCVARWEPAEAGFVDQACDLSRRAEAAAHHQ